MKATTKLKNWRDIAKYRSDVTTTLTHLTKPNRIKNEVDILIKILKDGRIKGNNPSVNIGNDPVVSFTDAPIISVAEMAVSLYEYCLGVGKNPDLTPCGLSFSKRYSYNDDSEHIPGARPVIYEEIVVAKKILKKSEYWRVVPLDLRKKDKIMDWTHLREWRVKGDFRFDLAKATVLLYDGEQYREFLEKARDNDIDIEELNGITCLKPLIY